MIVFFYKLCNLQNILFFMFNFFRNIFERRVFGLSSFLAEKLRIKVSFVRLIFIYATFSNTFTILIYLLATFLLKLINHFRYKKRKSVFDL